MSHIWVSHGKYRNEEWHTWQWVMIHNGLSYHSHRTGSGRTWESVIAYICTYIYTYIYIYIHIYTYVHVYKFICTYMYIYIYHISIYIFVCVNISIYICISIYKNICTKDTYSKGIAAQGARGPVPLFGGDDLTRCQVLCCQVIWSSIRRISSSQALG